MRSEATTSARRISPGARFSVAGIGPLTCRGTVRSERNVLLTVGTDDKGRDWYFDLDAFDPASIEVLLSREPRVGDIIKRYSFGHAWAGADEVVYVDDNYIVGYEIDTTGDVPVRVPGSQPRSIVRVPSDEWTLIGGSE